MYTLHSEPSVFSYVDFFILWMCTKRKKEKRERFVWGRDSKRFWIEFILYSAFLM